MQTTAEKLLNVTLASAVLLAYLVLALKKLGLTPARLAGVGLGARLRALTAATEPAIYLDSARVVVLLSWTELLPRLDLLARSLEHASELAVPKGVFRFVDVGVVPMAAVYAAAWLYKTGLVVAALGVRTRLAAGVAGVASVFVWSVAFCFDHTAHHHLVPLVLLTFSLSPASSPSLLDYVRALREKRPFTEVGRHPVWFRLAVMLPVVAAYLQAGLEKVIRSGPLWVNGTTLAGHLLRVGNEAGQRLAEAGQGWLALASAGALLWELAFGLVLFYPRLRVVGAVTAFGFHRVLAATMGLAFSHLVVALLFLVTPYEVIGWLGGRRAGAPAGAGGPLSEGAVAVETPGPTARAVTASPAGGRFVAVAALIVLQWVPMVMRGGVYPFLSYDMFNGFYRGSELMLRGARLVVEDARGTHAIDPEVSLGLGAPHVSEQIFQHFVSDHPRHAAYAASREGYCRQLLERVARTEPSTRALHVEGDTVRAGAPTSAEHRTLATCSR